MLSCATKHYMSARDSPQNSRNIRKGRKISKPSKAGNAKLSLHIEKKAGMGHISKQPEAGTAKEAPVNIVHALDFSGS